MRELTLLETGYLAGLLLFSLVLPLMMSFCGPRRAATKKSCMNTVWIGEALGAFAALVVLASPPSAPYAAACSAFTLMELLVVIALIAVLISILLPAISYAKFQARVATCSNNYRQWAVGVALYATEDGKGRLPSYPLPVDKMVQYRALETWCVPFA